MIRFFIYAMVYLGAGLMIYTIYGFVRFSRFVRRQAAFEQQNFVLDVPVILLVLFLIGYLVIAFLGHPDLVVSGILFGGSIFVYIMYRLLSIVTEHILESERLKARLSAAEESNQAKTAFLSSMSHEMRTPMNVILGITDVSLKSPSLSDEIRDNLLKIRRSGMQLLDLINNILDMNRLESGQMELKEVNFSVSDVLEQVSAIAGTLCDEKSLTYYSFFSDTVPGMYSGDEILIKKVLLALLDNAVKYTDSPGTIRLNTECIKEEEGVRTIQFSVSDTGIGIDRDFLPDIFNVFSKEDETSTNRYGGSGLSLAVAHSYVELMNGTITVESEKHMGSVFTVTIPLKYTGSICGKEEPSLEEVQLPPLSGRRILIVEDIADNAEIVADLLELENVESEHAENGQAALDMFRASPLFYYDAVLMDLRMPVMDGLTATRCIRSLPREDAGKVPILALTANAFESDIQASLTAGMNAHLAKPTDADSLYLALRQAIHNAELERGNSK